MEQEQYQAYAEALRQSPERDGLMAMAYRQLDENERYREAMSGGNAAALPQNDIDRGAILTEPMAVYYFEAIEGDSKLEFDDLPDLVLSSMDDEAVIGLMGENPDMSYTQEDIDQARAFFHEVFKGVVDIVPDSEESDFKNAKYYNKQYKAAQALAEEHGISTAAIFQSDDLYEELIRRIDTPERLVERRLASMQKITNKGLMGFVKQMVRGIAMLEGDIADAEQLEAIEKDLKDDPQFQEELDRMTDQLHSRVPLVIKQDLARFWGEEAYGALPEELKEKIKAGGKPSQTD